MSTNASLKRRDFLITATGVAGLGAGLGTYSARTAVAAESSASRPKFSDAVDKVLSEMEAQGNRFMSVPRPGCQLLNLLVKVNRARSVLELGTSQGYSALWLALALQETDGKLTTIDLRPERIETAKKNLTQAGLAGRVTFLHGNAHALVSTLEGPFDFVFLDADKPGNFDYFQKLRPKKLTPGALLLARKAVTMRDAMQDYLDALGWHPDFDAVIISVPGGDDYSLAYRRRT
jgi:caffeoyl-CoA O-methyltransferase